MGEKWKSLSDIEKRPYVDIAQKDNRRFEYETNNPLPKELSQQLMYKKCKKKGGKDSQTEEILTSNA